MGGLCMERSWSLISWTMVLLGGIVLKECDHMKDDKERENQTYYLPIGMCLGMSIGTAIGVATKNLSIYMPIGMSIGMCIGALMDAQNRKKAKDDEGTK